MDMNYTGENPFHLSPKDKALELYDKFQSKSPKMADYSTIYISTAVHHARLCVDEILKYARSHGFIGLVEYYEQVKQELEVL
jgi:hypothetical protein